jgi:hypothetical protein
MALARCVRADAADTFSNRPTGEGQFEVGRVRAVPSHAELQAAARRVVEPEADEPEGPRPWRKDHARRAESAAGLG